jgi:hypothetical protein
MPYLLDALRISALLLLSAGICAGALVLAAQLGLDRFWRMPRKGIAPETAINHLADIADFAKSGGLISIAAPAASLHMPLLSRGINLLIEGRPTHAVRETLQDELDKSTLGTSLKPAPLVLIALTSFGLVASLIASISLAVSAETTMPVLLAAFLVIPAAIGLALHAAMRHRADASMPQEVLLGMFAIETVCLIGSRRDGQTVRNHLNGLLPTAESTPAAAAA